MQPTGAIHPAMAEEQAHMVETKGIIAHERQLLDAQIPEQQQAVKRLHLEAGGMLSLDEEIAKRILAYLEQGALNLMLASSKPYFTRVDFIPQGEPAQSHYIGKWGVLRSPDFESVVVDWRSPVANLYYAGQIGPVDYTAPDGRVQGELTLKRQLDVAEGELRGVYDTDIVSQDAYLQQALSQASAEHLKEIVSTIQAEQNVVIRHGLNQPLIVQGVAGSGKTSIALHRIAWLLYAFREKLLPDQMMILAPSPMFLDYISQVLPELGVEKVRQTTLEEWFLALMGEPGWTVRAVHTLEGVMEADDQEREAITRQLRFMGSLRFGEIVSAYLEDLQARVVPEEDLRFGPVTLLTREQMRHILTVELADFPLTRRVKEMGKYIKKALTRATAQVEGWLRKTCEERVDALLAKYPDGALRRGKITKLYDSRDQRLAESQAAQKTYVKEALAKFMPLKVLDLYREMLDHPPQADLSQAEQALMGELAQAAQVQTGNKVVRPEDLPPLLMIHRAVVGLPRMDIRHVVIDEAQDLSALEFQLITQLIGHESMTIVGDLMQRIHAYRGLADWGEIAQGVFGGRASMKYLVISYRNTVEIMGAATSLAQRYRAPGQQTARPVLRHGPRPRVHGFAEGKARAAFLVAQVERWRSQGFVNIALLARDGARSKALYASLPKSLGATLVQGGETCYAAGLLVLPATLCKGLEFDAVAICDADGETWPDHVLSARLLYVCMTRPLHRLAMVHVGAITPLLGAVEGLEGIG